MNPENNGFGITLEFLFSYNVIYYRIEKFKSFVDKGPV